MTAEELQQNPGYKRWLTLTHDEILPFVQEEFGKRGCIDPILYFLNLTFTLTGMIVLGAWQAGQYWIGIGRVILNSLLGFVLTLSLLVPIHEGIHGLPTNWWARQGCSMEVILKIYFSPW